MIDSGAKISVQDTEEGQLITIYPQQSRYSPNRDPNAQRDFLPRF